MTVSLTLPYNNSSTEQVITSVLNIVDNPSLLHDIPKSYLREIKHKQNLMDGIFEYTSINLIFFLNTKQQYKTKIKILKTNKTKQKYGHRYTFY